MAKKNNSANLQARLRSYEEKQKAVGAKAARRKADNALATKIGAGAILLTLVATLAHSAVFPAPSASASPTAAASSSTSPSSGPQAPDAAGAENRTWTGTLQLNGKTLGISLDGKAAPKAAANFLALSKKGFFTGISCHRLTTAGIYVLQCGDPKGDGTGGPGYSFGPVENAPKDSVYKTGVLAMARQGGNGNSMGSQFFIVYKDSMIPSDGAGGYTVFGKVTSGLDVVAGIAAKGTTNGTGDGAPKVATTIGTIKLN